MKVNRPKNIRIKRQQNLLHRLRIPNDHEKYNHTKGSRYVTGASSLKIDSHEKKKMNSADADRYGRSYTIAEDELNRREEKSNDTLSDKDDANYQNLYYNFGQARDAVNRHIRRHPDQYKEGTIFESVKFI